MKLTMQEKIDLIRASIKVADFWGVQPNELIGFTAMLNEKKKDEWNKIANEVVVFQEMNIEDRAKALGFKLSKAVK